MRAGTSVDLGGLVLRPTASVTWLHDFGGVTASTTNRLAGVAFTVDASRPGRDAALVGIALARERGSAVSATAGLRWKL